tara:strand:- start:45 stop:641 length:597 start_codon:yes stop_codon:yes gene_type:complete
MGNKNSKVCFEKDYVDETFFNKSERKHDENNKSSTSSEKVNRLQYNDERKGMKIKELETAQLDMKKVLLNNLKEKQEISRRQEIQDTKNNQMMGQNNTIIRQNNDEIAQNHTIIRQNHDEIAQNHTIIAQNNQIIAQNNTIITQNNQILGQNNTSHQILQQVKAEMVQSKNEVKEHFDLRHYDLRSHHKTEMIQGAST